MKEDLEARVRELELIVNDLANHSAHMMYNQVNNWKPRPDMDRAATELETRAALAAHQPVIGLSDWHNDGCPMRPDPKDIYYRRDT
jgi:hypothetical protein